MNKIKLILIFLLLFSLECSSQQNGNSEIKQTIARNGIGIGSVIAIVVSWDRNKSILYAFYRNFWMALCYLFYNSS